MTEFPEQPLPPSLPLKSALDDQDMLAELQLQLLELRQQNGQLREELRVCSQQREHDLTERWQTQDALRESKTRFRTLVEWTPEAMVVHRRGTILYVNPAALTLFGATHAQQLVGRSTTELIHPDFRASQLARMQSLISRQPIAPMVESKFVQLDGTVIDVEVQGTSIDYDGDAAIHVSVRNITQRKRAQEKLQLAGSVFTHAREGILITDALGNIIDVNDAGCGITGYSRDDLLGKNPRILSAGRQGAEFYASMWHDLLEQGHWYGEVWNRRQDGAVYAQMMTISAVRDEHGHTHQYVALFSDITTAKEHQRQLEHIAHFDVLTNLPNRVLLADRLHQAMAQTQRRGSMLSLVYLDLDGFKAINDNYGHDVGDRLLATLAQRMTLALRDGDTLARLGGDEFVAVLLDLADVSACEPMLARLLGAAAQPVQVGELSLRVSASLGVSFYPQAQTVDAEALLRQGDRAMYQAKLAGKNCYRVFDPALDSSMRDHHEGLESIRRALREGEFVLKYQPKVNMRTGKVIGAEALVRWQHPTQGLLQPAAFLPAIANHALAVEMGEWVMDTALRQLETWQDSGLQIPVSVNVGARQLLQVGFVQRLREILGAHPRVLPSWLELELVETSTLEDPVQLSHVVQACRDVGVTMAMDDFGTGFTLLSYLKQLSVTQLKIDQSFVRDMLLDPQSLAILEGVLGLASAFGRQVIAEGVESAQHAALLLQLGCELAQGYGIAHPMAGDAIPAWSAAWQMGPGLGDLAASSRSDLLLHFAGAEHRIWVDAVEAFVLGTVSQPPTLDRSLCHFGTWLQGDGRASHGTHAAFADVEQAHDCVHTLATQVCKLREQARLEQAAAGLPELHRLRDGLLNQLKVLALAPG